MSRYSEIPAILEGLEDSFVPYVLKYYPESYDELDGSEPAWWKVILYDGSDGCWPARGESGRGLSHALQLALHDPPDAWFAAE